MPDACKPRACLARVGRIPTSATKGQTKVLVAHRFGYPIDPEIYLSGHSQRPISAPTARHGDPYRCRNRIMLPARRCVMRKFIAALALISLIAIPSLTETANAA